MKLAAAVVTVALVAVACSGGGDDAPPDQAAEAEPVITDSVGCEEIVRTFVGTERAVPGDQVQLDVFPITDGLAFVDGSGCVSVRDQADGAKMESAARIATETDRLVAVVVDPGRTDEDLAKVRALTDSIVGEFAGAEVALYALGPAEDSQAGGVALIEEDLSWAIAGDPSEVDDGWRSGRFLLEGSIDRATSVDVGWPTSDDPTAPTFGRGVFSVFDAASITDAELTIDHTHGVVVWINDVEVLASNLTPEGTEPTDPGPGTRTSTVTVPAAALNPGTNVISVDVYRADNGDPVNVDVSLIASDPQLQPVAALSPFGDPPDTLTLDQLRPGPTPGRLAEALDQVVADIETTHDDETAALRSVVVVSPEGVPDLELEGRADAVLVWMGDGDGSRGVIDLGVDWQEDDPVATLVDRLNHIAASRLVVGICSRGTRFEAEVEVGVVNLTTTLREPPPEDPGGECDPTAASEYEPPAPDEVAVTFSTEQKAAWEERVAANDRTPFRASVDLGTGWGPAPGELRLRGQSSIDCERKSYAVNLDTGHRRALTEEVASDEFFLLSLCLDAGYVRTASMLDVLSGLGLFPVGARLVSLDLDGDAAGIYLLTEQPEEALRDGQPRLDGIVRRALDTSFQSSSTVWTATGREDAVFDPYEGTIELAEAGGADMLARLDDELDVAAYLTWLGAMSATENGDYVDEVFFPGVGTLADGVVRPFWYPVAWDPDDLFSPCHFDDFQFQDPYGLTSCAEARLDHALLGDPEGYAAYVDALDAVLASLTPEVFAAALAATRDRLGALVDDEVAAAMPEIAELSGTDTTTAAGFLEAVDREVENLASAYARRHDTLGERIAVWRQDHSGGTPATGLVAEFAPVAAAGTVVPIRVNATDPSGSLDRGRSGTVTVAVGPTSVTAPMRRGVAVASLSTDEFGEQEVSIDGVAVGQLTVVEPPPVAAPTFISNRVTWGPGLVSVRGQVFVASGGTLVVEPGTTVIMGPGSNIDVQGRLEMRGTAEAPVLLTELGDPWGGIRVAGEAALSHTLVTGGGADLSRVFGHSDSQPLIHGSSAAVIELDGVVVADSSGKAVGVDGGMIDIVNSVFTRTDTGAEFLNSEFSVRSSWFLDFPSIDSPPIDDDNDAIYLGATSAASSISDSVFIGGADDGIDHAGADVTIERVWVEDFAHECIATSVGGTILISDSVLSLCEHGLELGYGTPAVFAEHVLVMDNAVGVRHGDEYAIAAEGALILSSAILLGNGESITADVGAFAVSTTVSDDPDTTVDGVSVASPRLDPDLVWRAGGLEAAGIITGWP